MAGGNVLKSFLATLAFQVDAASQAKFVNALGGATRGAKNLGLEVLGAATAVYSGVAIIAAQYEKLFYQSRRTGESTENILEMSYAFSQIGLSAGAGEKALEGFTMALRQNPGKSGLLAALGVTGNGPKEQFESLIGQLKKMPFQIASQYAELFGVDPTTLLMLEQGLGKMKQLERERARVLHEAGLDTQEAAAQGQQFMQALRGTWMKIGTLFDSIALDLEKSGLTEWTKRFGDAVEQILINKKQIEDAAKAKGGNASFADKYVPDAKDALGFLGYEAGNYYDFLRHQSPTGRVVDFAEATLAPMGDKQWWLDRAAEGHAEASQTINVTINGVSDPHEAARLAGAEVRSAGDELRNAKGRTP